VATYDPAIFTGVGNYTFATANLVIINKAVGAATTVFLPPTPVIGGEYVVKDGKGDAGTNAITLDGNGHTIDGLGTYGIGVNYGSVTLFFDGTGFLVIGVRP
jgi:hypothetical protein